MAFFMWNTLEAGVYYFLDITRFPLFPTLLYLNIRVLPVPSERGNILYSTWQCFAKAPLGKCNVVLANSLFFGELGWYAPLNQPARHSMEKKKSPPPQFVHRGSEGFQRKRSWMRMSSGIKKFRKDKSASRGTQLKCYGRTTLPDKALNGASIYLVCSDLIFFLYQRFRRMKDPSMLKWIKTVILNVSRVKFSFHSSLAILFIIRSFAMPTVYICIYIQL